MGYGIQGAFLCSFPHEVTPLDKCALRNGHATFGEASREVLWMVAKSIHFAPPFRIPGISDDFPKATGVNHGFIFP